MLSKRKHENLELEGEEVNVSSYQEDASDDEVDIFSALTGQKRARIDSRSSAHDSSPELDDDELSKLIKESISKRDVKQGTEVIKKTKGKVKIAKGEVGGGSFQSMGLHPPLLRSLTLQGFRIPTPIQRLSIPALLADPPRDLVGMARTGSGKSLAYLIPLVQRLNGRHSTAFGARALILIPTRELALQILKVGKELTRGWSMDQGDHAGDSKTDSSSNKGQRLRWGLIVGGEGLDEQFETVTNNPDVIIATPGRLLHLIIEMNLDLKSVQYVVFDEADRLFEMGFETALTEILHRLPTSRQTLLFSATLPKSLVEFAKAGLQDPKLVRLDAESKISSDLKMAFFSVKQVEKEVCLLSLLRDVIKVPLGSNEPPAEDEPELSKGKGKASRVEQFTAPHQTLVFAATKHHVEYLTALLTTAGYSVSHIYSSLDQTARKQQMDHFRRGVTNILVVTDVAARGIDIPILENVVNYDFPQGARVFVHRVGRTARAGRQGWAWSFVTNVELPYLLDLQLFLGRPLKSDAPGLGESAYTETLVLGTFDRERLDEDIEYLKTLEETNHSLPSLRQVMARGQSMYERSKGKASPASYKRAKEMSKDPQWALAGSDAGMHPILMLRTGSARKRDSEAARKALLQSVSSFKPSETVFEVGSKKDGATSMLMKQRRKALSKSVERASASKSVVDVSNDDPATVKSGDCMEPADDVDIAMIFDKDNASSSNYRDNEFYISYHQKDASVEKGYSLTDGASFAEQARGATFDLTGDEKLQGKLRRQMHWDKKKKRFVQGDGTGADNVKLVKTESGQKLPATYRSGRFDEWKAKTRTALPKVGEAENEGSRDRHSGHTRFKHNKITVSKPLDKLSKDYERKVRVRSAAAAAQGGDSESTSGRRDAKGKGLHLPRNSRFSGKSVGKVKNELKTVDQIHKDRKLKEKRRAKNARPSRKGKR
ncbi:DEAD-domain-containing protein [Fistulina hepatica ATCC 64428]|uniref:RNA helicase n=1 Tax=Fistulina hepatica ATCC 64428 TaxID=1128425 RepID=A0A0D7AFZ6_9AGAR|nr:DEAD-domain-containing protein [Fistulina hepatica ATCC 64428]